MSAKALLKMLWREVRVFHIAAGAAGIGILVYLVHTKRNVTKSRGSIKDDWITRRMVVNKNYGNIIVGNMSHIQNAASCVLTIDGDWFDSEAVFALTIKGSETSVQEAEYLLNHLIEISPEINKTMVDIPVSKLKLVIGSLGEPFIDICRRSGTRMYLKCDPTFNPAKPFTLEIQGSYEQNMYAYNLVSVVLKNESAMPPAQNKFDDIPEVFPQELINSTQDSKYVDVTVSSINSLSSFWVQLQQLSHSLDSMERRLAEYYTDMEASPAVTKPRVGMMIQVPYLQQGRCHRAKIVSVDKTIKALFVDYGDCEEININDVKHLPEDFMLYKAFAIECCLHGLIPTTLNNKGDLEWTEESLDFFESLVSEVPSKVLMARKMGDHEIFDVSNGRKIKKVIPALDLVDTNHLEDLNIANQMVSSGLAQWDAKNQGINSIEACESEVEEEFDF